MIQKASFKKRTRLFLYPFWGGEIETQVAFDLDFRNRREALRKNTLNSGSLKGERGF